MKPGTISGPLTRVHVAHAGRAFEWALTAGGLATCAIVGIGSSRPYAWVVTLLCAMGSVASWVLGRRCLNRLQVPVWLEAAMVVLYDHPEGLPALAIADRADIPTAWIYRVLQAMHDERGIETFTGRLPNPSGMPRPTLYRLTPVVRAEMERA